MLEFLDRPPVRAFIFPLFDRIDRDQVDMAHAFPASGQGMYGPPCGMVPAAPAFLLPSVFFTEAGRIQKRRKRERIFSCVVDALYDRILKAQPPVRLMVIIPAGAKDLLKRIGLCHRHDLFSFFL